MATVENSPRGEVPEKKFQLDPIKTMFGLEALGVLAAIVTQNPQVLYAGTAIAIAAGVIHEAADERKMKTGKK